MAEAVTMQRWEAVDLIIETEFPSVSIDQVESCCAKTERD